MKYHGYNSSEPWFQTSTPIPHYEGGHAKVAVASCMRLASNYSHSFIGQLRCLQQTCYAIEAVIIVHDKPNEQTQAVLEGFERCDLPIHLVQEAQTDAGVQTMAAKAEQWAAIANQAIEECLRTNCTHVLWLESDLTFPMDLLDRLVNRDCHVVAPIVFLGSTFYDTWGFRDLSGQKLNLMKISEMLKGKNSFLSMVEVGSVGSCVLFQAEIFRKGIRFRGEYENGLLVGICQDARKLGYRVWADTGTSIIHPTNSWRDQIWVIDSLRAVTLDGTELLNMRDVNRPVASFLPEYLEKELLQITSLKRRVNYPWIDVSVEKFTSERRISITVVGDKKNKPGKTLIILARLWSLPKRLFRILRSLGRFDQQHERV